jgi:hypothetical protein
MPTKLRDPLSQAHDGSRQQPSAPGSAQGQVLAITLVAITLGVGNRCISPARGMETITGC